MNNESGCGSRSFEKHPIYLTITRCEWPNFVYPSFKKLMLFETHTPLEALIDLRFVSW